MSKKKIILLLSILFLNACSSSIEKPDNLLSKDEMAAMIADFAIYEQASVIQQSDSLIDMNNIGKAVLKYHKMSTNQFLDSYLYYVSKPEDMKTIYDRVNDILLEKDPNLKNSESKEKVAESVSSL